MKTKHKIGIWGQYGDGSIVADGQAVKTNIITTELIKRYGAENISYANTNAWKKHPVKFLYESIKLFFGSENIAILPADNGFKVIVNLYNILLKIKNRNIFYIVIGGFLPELLNSKPIYIKMLKKYKGIFVETANLEKDLKRFDFNNISILSNMKKLNTRGHNDIKLCEDSNVTFCILSRVSEDKGISDAIDAVKLFNEKYGNCKITLDIYGMIAPQYKEKFERLLDDNKLFVSYKGIVDYNKTVETLSQYFAMLFPTYFHGEGFPGTVIDCYNSGLPIIATDWLYNKDVITDGVNGILVPIKNPQALCEAIEKLYNDRQLALTFAYNNLNEADKYLPENVLKKFYAYIDNQ